MIWTHRWGRGAFNSDHAARPDARSDRSVAGVVLIDRLMLKGPCVQATPARTPWHRMGRSASVVLIR